MKILIDNTELKIFERSSNTQHQGVAFAKSEGDIFRLYLEYPALETSGIPLVSFFIKNEENKGNEQIFGEIEEDFNETSSVGLENYLVLIYDHNEKKYHCHIKNSNSVEECDLVILDAKHQNKAIVSSIISGRHIDIDKKITIIGIDGIGEIVALHLACMGIKSLTLIDDTILAPENLHYSIATQNDIGRYKADIVRDQILMRNNQVNITIYKIDIVSEIENMILMDDAEIIINLTNNSSTFHYINKFAVNLEKSLILCRFIQGGAFGYVFKRDPSSIDNPCFDCIGDGSFISREGVVSFVKQGNNMPSPPQLSPTVLEHNILAYDLLPFAEMILRCLFEMLSKSSVNAPNIVFSNASAFVYARDSNTPIQILDSVEYAKRWWYPINIDKISDCPTCSK